MMENEESKGLAQLGELSINSVTVIADKFEPDEPEPEISEEV